MKILFIGVFNSTSTNNSQSRSFRELGHQVIEYDYREMSNFFNHDLRDQDLISLITREQPELTIFSKCNQLNITILQHSNRIGSSFLWYMDPLHNIDTELILKVKQATFVGVALQDSYRYLSRYNKNVFLIPEGFDPENYFPVKAKKKLDVSFIGSLYGHRKNYYDKLKFKVINNAFNMDHNIVVAESKINLNFTSGGISDRVYKILAANGFLLTQPWPEMENYFKPSRDFVIFNSIDDLKSKIKYYLIHKNLREKISLYGHHTVQKYTRLNWAKEILKYYEITR